jgi:hypothetical protein
LATLRLALAVVKEGGPACSEFASFPFVTP